MKTNDVRECYVIGGDDFVYGTRPQRARQLVADYPTFFRFERRTVRHPVTGRRVPGTIISHPHLRGTAGAALRAWISDGSGSYPAVERIVAAAAAAPGLGV